MLYSEPRFRKPAAPCGRGPNCLAKRLRRGRSSNRGDQAADFDATLDGKQGVGACLRRTAPRETKNGTRPKARRASNRAGFLIRIRRKLFGDGDPPGGSRRNGPVPDFLQASLLKRRRKMELADQLNKISIALFQISSIAFLLGVIIMGIVYFRN